MPDQEDSSRAYTHVLSGDFRGAVVNVGNTFVTTAGAGASPGGEGRPRVFLSYGWNDDKPFVIRLQRDLEDAGFDVWRDETDLQSRGPDLSQELIREIDGRERFVPVIGPAAFASAAVQSEWSRAMLVCKAVTPVWRLGDREPPATFRAKLYVDFREERPGYTYNAGLDTLIRLLSAKPLVPGRFLTRFPELPPGVIPRKELAPLRRLLESPASDGSTVAITGLSATRTVQAPGGLGKSVLATIFARECQTRWAFEDGLIWLPVGKAPTITALQAEIGALFGDKPEEYADERRGAARLQRLLHDRKLLIVLDDVWNYHHVESLVVDAPDCRWLITTRLGGVADGLGLPGERVIRLEYLDDDEGLALIARRLETTVEGLLDRASCLAIVRELGGHTQAVAIAAARLKQGMSAAGLLERYRRAKDGDNPLALLNLEERRELNLELSFGESYTFMDEAGRRRVRLLGVFAPEGTFDAAAAAAVWAEDEDSAGDALRELVAASLLTRAGEERYEQHSLLRAYALGLLRQRGEEEEARKRQFVYYATEYGDHDRNTPYVAGRQDRIDGDFANIQAAIEWGVQFDAEPACDLVVALSGSYMQFRQPVELRLKLLEQAHDAAVQIKYVHGMANTLKAIGDVQNFRMELDAALESYAAALGLFRAVGARLGEANTLQAIGDVQNFRKELDAALESYAAALGLFRAVGARLGEANTLQAIGDVQNFRKELDAALASYAAALGLFRAVGARLGEANTLMALGYRERNQSNYEAARSQFRAAKAIYAAIGARLGETNAVLGLADLDRAQEKYIDATNGYQQALKSYLKIGNPFNIGLAFQRLGFTARDAGDRENARHYFQKALEIFSKIGAHSAADVARDLENL